MKLSKAYDPGQYEADIYALWEKSLAFQPSPKGKPYAIVMPPPNANAGLHIGHALTLALEDIAVRYHRLLGDSSLLVPGADHAGFETQVVYEKHLAKTGKSRLDYSREELYDQIWQFVANNRTNFESQVRRLGIGCDWSRYTFTLDEHVIKRAYATFQKMWSEGLIYRGERLVNFCTFHGTAFADIEVTHKQESGKLWRIRYPLTDSSGIIEVATTRPETMLGDVAVAVHPDDDRYKHLVGKTVRLPLTQRDIPVIADSFVDPRFGTGAVKLTPAHDQHDYDAAERHDLPKMTVIDHEGKMTGQIPAEYRGLDADQARRLVLDRLKEQGQLAGAESLTHSVGRCYKCGTVIQPLLRDQWFVAMRPLANKAIAALESNKITFYPAAKKAQLIDYLGGLRDWNISRQIAWGIPIPAFQNVDDPADWIYDERVGEELITVDGKTYHRDPDVFDTWFSSGSWPYATLQFPDGEDFRQFYPLSLMETGGEILYPWVSRMIMLGLYVTGEVPFRSVYIHGYVMAEDGTKMSKSVGNVVDPLPVIERYGSDALRMGLIAGRAPAVNRGYDARKVEEARNFCNKLWNIARYIESGAGDGNRLRGNPKPETAADHWLLSKLQQVIEVMTSALDRYNFGEAYEALYHFVWDDLADWYIEASKSAGNPALMLHALESTLQLAHPFAPFVTETIWQTLEKSSDPLLATSHWPRPLEYDHHQAETFDEIRRIVTEARYIISTLKASGVTMYYSDVDFLGQNSALIKRLARLQDVVEVKDGTGLYLTTTRYRCWLDIDAATAREYQERLSTQIDAQKRLVEQLKGRLADKTYLSKAPRHIVRETRDSLEQATNQLATIEREYQRFNLA